MRTRISRVFNRKIEHWTASNNNDGFGGLTNSYALQGLIWASVRDARNNNYDSVGSSQNLTEKRILVRKPNINTNTDLFVIDGKAYQINEVIANYKENQFECICEATNFELNGS